jgi:hypothetical protein
MIAVRTEQLIYSRVEAPYSPRGQGGFQTVWKSDGLTAAEVTAVEGRIQCFRPAARARRLQFFQLPGGRVVLAHTRQIAPHPEIVDHSGREGAFLVHCLLFDPRDFHRLGADPFALFCDPVEEPAALLEKFGKATGWAPQIDVEPRAQRGESVRWSAEEADRLLLLAMRGDEMRRQGRGVAIAGDGEEIEEALQIVFRLLPRNRRFSCSFNTMVEGCPIERGLYWAIGVQRRQGNEWLEVDARARRVSLPAGGAEDRHDLYLSWLHAACTRGDLAAVMAQADTVEAFHSGLAGEPTEMPRPLQVSAIESFVRFHRPAIVERLGRSFEHFVGRALAQDLACYLFEDVYRADFQSLLAATVFSSESTLGLARLAFQWLGACGEPPAEGDLKELQKLARRASHKPLLHWASTLGKKTDVKGRDEALATMTSHDFQLVLRKLLAPIAPVDFVAPHHLAALLQPDLLARASQEELVELFERVLEIDGGDHLGRMAEVVYVLGEKWLSRLARAIRDHRVQVEFRRAVEDRASRRTSPLWRRR